MIKIKIVLCNCRGLSEFLEGDMNAVPFALENELDIEYAVVHPEMCGRGGRELLADIFKNADKDTYVISGACDPDRQMWELEDVLAANEFPQERFFPIDIRLANNERIVDRIRTAVEAMLGLTDAP